MRASTLFALTLALLTGLAALVGARMTGLIGKADPPRKEVQVLVAGRNLFPGDMIEASHVKLRALRVDELEQYDANKKKYLPAVPQAAAMRVTKRAIEADTPILRDDLQDMVKPEPLHLRLLPNMRAVNLSVPKDQSAGGLIQVGEWVDVYLTTAVSLDDSKDKEVTKTAAIAHRLRVIAKRNALWNVFSALPEGKPVQFTLEANPYRAGLIEYARARGTLTLSPVSAVEQRELEEKRGKLFNNGSVAAVLPVSFVDVKLQGDYQNEESRVDGVSRGEYAIGTADLARIFELQTPAPPVSDHAVETFNGLRRKSTLRFSNEGLYVSADDQPAARAAARRTNSNLNFNPPECKTCKEKAAKTPKR